MVWFPLLLLSCLTTLNLFYYTGNYQDYKLLGTGKSRKNCVIFVSCIACKDDLSRTEPGVGHKFALVIPLNAEINRAGNPATVEHDACGERLGKAGAVPQSPARCRVHCPSDFYQCGRVFIMLAIFSLLVPQPRRDLLKRDGEEHKPRQSKQEKSFQKQETFHPGTTQKFIETHPESESPYHWQSILSRNPSRLSRILLRKHHNAFAVVR